MRRTLMIATATALLALTSTASARDTRLEQSCRSWSARRPPGTPALTAACASTWPASRSACSSAWAKT